MIFKFLLILIQLWLLIKYLLSKQQEIKCIASQIYTKPSLIINQSSTSYFSNMKVTKNHYSYFDIMAGTSLVCTIKVTLNTTTNIDNYIVLCINSKSASPTSTTTIFKNWKTNSITTNINSPKQGYVNTNTKGRITFSTSGITYSKEISNSLKMKCYWLYDYWFPI